MAGRHKNSPVQTAQGTGGPSPDKDRTIHDSKRGVKAVKLEDLGKERPTPDDLANFLSYAEAESDRGAATMAASLVEIKLRDALVARLSDIDQVEKWLDGDNAPFKTFNARIKFAYALGIYDRSIEGRLDLVRKVRNAFAHRALPLDFSHPAVAQACDKIIPDSDLYGAPMRVLFALFCQHTVTLMDAQSTKTTV